MIRDAHVLIGRDHWLSQNKPTLAHEQTGDHVAAAYTRVSDQWLAYAAPFPSSRDGTFADENAVVLDAAQRDARILPVLAVNPRIAASRRFVEAALEDGAPVAALAIWPIGATAQRSMDFIALAHDAWLTETAVRFQVPLHVHVGAGNEQRIGRVESVGRYCPDDAIHLAAACPHVRFNLSHALRLSQSALRAMRQLPNAFTDLSGLSCHQRWMEGGFNVFPSDDAGELADMPAPELVFVLVREYGLGERAMFGSSYPFGLWWGSDVASEIRIVRNSGLTADEQRRLLDTNAAHFFRVAPAPVLT